MHILCILWVTRSRPDGSCALSLKTWEERSQSRWTWWWGWRRPWTCCCWPRCPPWGAGPRWWRISVGLSSKCPPRSGESLNLMMRVMEALDLLLLAQMPPMGRRAPMVSTESPSMWHCWVQADWILLKGLFTQPSRAWWRISRSLGVYFFVAPGSRFNCVEVTKSSSNFCQHLNFFNWLKVQMLTKNEDDKVLRNHSK